MSTRCQIGFYETEGQSILKPSVLIYRHSDGYPGTVSGKKYGVLPALVPFLKRFDQERGLGDTMYCSAWALHHLIQKSIEHKIEWNKKRELEGLRIFGPSDGKDFLGFGVCDEFHGGIEFFYRVYPSKLEVYKVSYAFDRKHTVEDFKKVKTVKLKVKK